jgi:hypothetical protein
METRSRDVRDLARTQALSVSLPEPLFNVRLGWSIDYDAIFSGQNLERTSIDASLKQAQSTGRVLLIGPGGGAKTIILRRLARKAARSGDIVVLVDLRQWTAKEYDEWRHLTAYSQRMDFLLLRFGQPSLGTAELDLLRTALRKLVLIDGLNEVRASTGGEILDAADDFVRFGIRTSVIISDRLVRRSLQSGERWRLAAVLPLSDNEVERQIKSTLGSQKWNELADDTRALLRSPYFLDAYLRHGKLQRTRAEELHDYFVRHALGENEIERVAAAAFRLYSSATRTFSLAAFIDMVGAETAKKLTDSRALIQNGDLAYFDHHLKHDYLVSKFISADPQRWTAENLNVITFNASSFDTVVLAMEQMVDLESADRFLRALYDWNIYGAGYALSDGRHERVSPDMTTVVHAMFAERRWEIFRHTAKTAEDILNLIGTELSRSLLAAPTAEAVLDIVREQHGEAPWFTAWRDLFTARPGIAAENHELQHITDADSVMGWTSSNVLRRKLLSDDQQHAVRQILEGEAAAVARWRATHVLGRFPSAQNADSFFQALIRDTREVRYGATRSLMEMAARGGRQLSEIIVERLAGAAGELAQFKNVVDEFQRTLIIKQNVAPTGWTKLVLPAVAAFQRATMDYKNREEWDKTVQTLIDLYGYE